jgi:predicted TIM-barrel fold metal-dependent hydrolase
VVWRDFPLSSEQSHPTSERGANALSHHPRYTGPVIDVHTHYDANSRAMAAHANRIGSLSAAISVWDVQQPPVPYDDDLAAWKSCEPALLRCYAPNLSDIRSSGFERDLGNELKAAAAQGAVGVKVWKNLGLWLRDESGARVTVDDPRLEPLWTSAAETGLPVLIHVGDPPEFWDAITPQNPRYNDIKDRPEWWYSQGDFPSLQQIHEELEHLVAEHPSTVFVAAHFGSFIPDPERWFAAYANFYVDTAAAIAVIGAGNVEHTRGIFCDWPSRILFGTDLARAAGFEYPAFSGDRWALREYFDSHWRFFETDERDLEHPIPEQLPWKVTGLDLPDAILRALYCENATRLYRLDV